MKHNSPYDSNNFNDFELFLGKHNNLLSILFYRIKLSISIKIFYKNKLLYQGNSTIEDKLIETKIDYDTLNVDDVEIVVCDKKIIFDENNIKISEINYKDKKKNFLIGGKLGDFINSLYGVKCLSSGVKSDIYLTNGDEFTFGLEKTYNDIYDAVIKQPFVDNFYIYTEPIDDIIYVDYSKSERLYKGNWYQIMHNYLDVVTKYENEPWLINLNCEGYDYYKDKILIHYSNRRVDDNYDEFLKDLLSQNDCIFVSFDENEYNNFKFKDLVIFDKCKNFNDLYSKIEHCKFFIGNQSTPLVIAHALFKSHLGMLYDVDAIHFKDSFNSNYFWFDNQKGISKNFININKFINLSDIEKYSNSVDLSNIKISIKTNKYDNKVFIHCNKKITILVKFFVHDIVTNSDKYLFSKVSNFDNNTFWFMFFRELSTIKHLKVELDYGNITLEETIIKI
jgi:hypothetical protein